MRGPVVGSLIGGLAQDRNDIARSLARNAEES